MHCDKLPEFLPATAYAIARIYSIARPSFRPSVRWVDHRKMVVMGVTMGKKQEIKCEVSRNLPGYDVID